MSHAAVQDRAVLARFRSGEPDAISEIYRTHSRLVFQVALRVLGSTALADEVVQETFVKAWKASAKFDEVREMKPWLATIARRTAIDVARRERAWLRKPLELADTIELGFHEPDIEYLDNIHTVRAALDKLPENEQSIVRLQFFGGLTHNEIADRLCIPLGTVKSRSHRAYCRLARSLASSHRELVG